MRDEWDEAAGECLTESCWPVGERPRLSGKTATALRAAYARGRREGMEEAAGIVTEHYQTMTAEHRLLLVNRATAIRSKEPTP